MCCQSSFFVIVLFFGLVCQISSETAVVKPNVNDGEDTQCVLCEFIMNELEEYLGSNATEQEITMAMEKVCSLLPQTVQDECKLIIEDYAAEIIDLLINEVSPAAVCTAIKLCSNSNKHITFPGPQCAICTEIVGELTGMLSSNATTEEIEAALEKVCSLLPSSYKTECDQFVESYTATIVHLLVEKVAPELICSLIGLCSTNKVMKPTQVEDDSECVLCEFIMKELDSMLSENSTKAEIEAALDKVCSLLPSSISSECNDFINKYVPTLLNLLVNEVSPQEICTLLRFCTTKSVHKQDAAKTKPVPKHVTDEYCSLCKIVMSKVDSLLNDNATQAEIEAALEKVCSLLPSTISSECDDFITKYLPALLQLLVNDISPQEVCTLLKFCTTKSVLKQVTIPKPAPKQVTDKYCVLCEFVMREVDSLLSENATEKEITVVIENICTILPGTLKEQCTSFLNIYGPELIALIVQQLDPKTICTALGACPKTPEISTSDPVKANSQLCPFCEMIMAEVKDLLSKNSTEEDIKKALDKACSLIPGKFSTDCLLLVNRYADAIIKLILQDIQPEQICTALGFCKSSIATSDDECDLCQMLVKFVDDFIRNNSTEEEIVKGLLDVCSILPGNLKGQCIDIVNQYGTVIPGLIAELLSPLKVCEVLGICSQGKLGTSLCSRGPVTWCASLENAKLCNAVTHCQRHVWN